MAFDFITNKPVFESQQGQPVSQQMIDAAAATGAEHDTSITEALARTVLDVGLPYSMKGVSAAAVAAGVEDWIVDLMLDSAIAAID